VVGPEILHVLAERRGAIAGLGVLLAAVCGWFAARRVDRLVARPWSTRLGDGARAALLAALAFGAAALSAWYRPPLPAVHDEASYLLAADTFARGRLTNPSPPSPAHFETFHVVVEPTYQSKYPPAQGLVLALGQVLFGHPLAGVWLGAAACAAAMAYALRALVGPGVATVFGLLAAARFASTGYWAQSYWGGAVAAAAGALVVGGALRIVRAPRSGAVGVTGAACALGVGSGVLALTRPYEGLVLAAVAHVLVAVALLRARGTRPAPELAQAALAWLAPLVLALGFLAGYNRAVTGDVATLPYVLHEERYAAAPNFLVQEPIERPRYRHPEFERLWAGWVLAEYERRRESTWVAVAGEKLAVLGPFFVGWVWLPFFLVGCLVRAGAGSRAFVAAGFLALLVETFDSPHYAAPFTAAVVLVCAGGAATLLAAADVRVRAATALALGAALCATLAEAVVEVHAWRPSWPAQRAALVGELEALPGEDVVFVATDHTGLSDRDRRTWENIDWVVNGAAPLEQPVVFVRDLGPEANAALLRALPARRAWRIVLPGGLASGRAFDGLEPVPGDVSGPTSAQSAR
jgi:hypothetical protein